MTKLDAKLDQAKGGLKEVAGKVTGDKKLEAEGAVDKVVGTVKEGIETAKDVVSDTINKLKK